MPITWDEPKRLSNIAKHGLDFAALDDAFFASAIIFPARSPRLYAVGRIASGIAVTVVFSPLGTQAIAVISMRRANRKERTRINAP